MYIYIYMYIDCLSPRSCCRSRPTSSRWRARRSGRAEAGSTGGLIIDIDVIILIMIITSSSSSRSSRSSSSSSSSSQGGRLAELLRG